MSLKQHVQGTVKFLQFVNTDSKKEIWYECEDGFQFPIPLAETEGAVFGAKDQALYFMRWIRKHVELIAAAHIEKETIV